MHSRVQLLVLRCVINGLLFQFSFQLLIVEKFEVSRYLVIQVEVTFKGGPIKFLFRTYMIHSGNCSVW